MINIRVIVATCIILGLIIQLKDTVRTFFVDVSSSVASGFANATEFVESSIDEHIRASSEVARLKEQSKKHAKTKELLIYYKRQLEELSKTNDTALINPSVQLVRSIAYAKLNDQNKVWIDFDGFDKNRIYGLVKDGKAQGIVIEKNERPLALLVGDEKCAFSVLVGDVSIPGVVMGKNRGKIIVKYIPLWANPKIGDRVITSGLDGLFFRGIEVGVVSKIAKEQFYKKLELQVQEVSQGIPTYLHIIDTKKDIQLTSK